MEQQDKYKQKQIIDAYKKTTNALNYIFCEKEVEYPIEKFERIIKQLEFTKEQQNIIDPNHEIKTRVDFVKKVMENFGLELHFKATKYVDDNGETGYYPDCYIIKPKKEIFEVLYRK